MLAMPPRADRVDDIGAGAPAREQRRDQLGRILKVGVHVDDDIAARGGHPGQHAFGHAEPARQVQDLDARVPFAFLQQNGQRRIGGCVVDINHLIGRMLRRKHRIQPRDHRRNRFGFVAE
jgi:hypothetical protein